MFRVALAASNVAQRVYFVVQECAAAYCTTLTEGVTRRELPPSWVRIIKNAVVGPIELARRADVGGHGEPPGGWRVMVAEDEYP